MIRLIFTLICLTAVNILSEESAASMQATSSGVSITNNALATDSTAADTVSSAQKSATDINDTIVLMRKTDTASVKSARGLHASAELQVTYKDHTGDTIDGSDLAKKIGQYKEIYTSRIVKSRKQGYGGGFIIQPMILGLNVNPVNDLARTDNLLKRQHFSGLHGYNPILVNGAIFYGGVGKGVRIGFGGWSGDVAYASNAINADSIMVMELKLRYGAMMIEKAFIRNNLNILAGGMIGTGRMEVTRAYRNQDAFKAVWDYDLDDYETAEARYLGLELHSGVTVSLLSWFHVGLDANALFMMSVSGFGGYGNNGFATANPGLRLRLVFGNLG